MGETDLTKRIKRITHTFNPKIPSSMRTIRYADEVWTTTGIVDSIRFEDYYSKDEWECHKSDYDNQECLKNDCYGCFFRKHIYEVDMMVTCYEVKITVSDFKSKNGHNFHGNENYYVVPKEIVKKIEPFVSVGIGILSYNGNWLRTARKAEWRNVDHELKTLLLYNAMKKWCDGTQREIDAKMIGEG